MTDSSPLVLVVDDDDAIREALERALRLEGFAVDTAPGGRAALEAVARRAPAAVVLDVTMPDLNGRTVCARLRADGIRTPILILSARDEVEDRIAGLQAGADDYLVKPFAVEELIARLRALLRRAGDDAAPTASPRARSSSATSSSTRRRARSRAADGAIELTRREFELLEVFARNPGIVLSRDRLLELVWGYDWAADGNVVDVFVSYLRRKLEAGGEPRMIQTVRGVGFVLRVPEPGVSGPRSLAGPRHPRRGRGGRRRAARREHRGRLVSARADRGALDRDLRRLAERCGRAGGAARPAAGRSPGGWARRRRSVADGEHGRGPLGPGDERFTRLVFAERARAHRRRRRPRRTSRCRQRAATRSRCASTARPGARSCATSPTARGCRSPRGSARSRIASAGCGSSSSRRWSARCSPPRS